MNPENLKSIPKQRYYDQQLLKLEDFQREQNFHLAYRELQNQLLLKSGILTGLTIEQGETQGQLQITPGVAIDNSGRIIILTDSAKLNNTYIKVQFGQFLLDLSNPQYHNKTWLLTVEYNQEEDQDHDNSSQWNEIPKLALIDTSTNETSNTQISLATLNITTSQTDEIIEINIEIDSSIRANVNLIPERIPELNVEQIPNIPVSKISGKLNIDQIPELSANKIASGKLNIDQIPELSADKIASGLFNLGQIPNLPASKIEGSLGVERIPELDAEKITSGVFKVEQIPSLPASKLIGKIDPDQIPNIQLDDGTSLKFYLNKPNINGEEQVTLTWLSKLADKVVLEYVFENEIQKKEWNDNLDQEKTYELNPYQTSTYTLTAYKNDAVQDQKQFIVQVIPNEFQFLKKLYYEGVELSSALDSCVKRYRLLPLTKSTIENLVDASKRANYSGEDALNALVGYLKLTAPVITSFSFEYNELIIIISWNTVENADNYELIIFDKNDNELERQIINGMINHVTISLGKFPASLGKFPAPKKIHETYKVHLRSTAAGIVFSPWSEKKELIILGNLICHYPLSSDTKDAVGNHGDIIVTLNGARRFQAQIFQEGAVYLDEDYALETPELRELGSRGFINDRSRLPLEKVAPHRFAISINFKVSDYPSEEEGKPVFALISKLNKAVWLGFHLQKDGFVAMRVWHKKSSRVEGIHTVSSDTRYSLENWHEAMITCDPFTGSTQAFLDRTLVCSYENFVYPDRQTDSSRIVTRFIVPFNTPDHYGSKYISYKGYLNNLKVFQEEIQF